MLNKIWAALIISGLLFATGQDIVDEIHNRHRNGIPLSMAYSMLPAASDQLILSFNKQSLNAHFIDSQRLTIHLDKASPQRLVRIAEANGNSQRLNARIISRDPVTITLLLPELHWLKLRQVTQTAFDMAELAVKLALGLIGIMALWLGLMRIAEHSGLIQTLVRFVHPLLRWLFPGIPKDHPALGSISMNMAANILGLGNAATPLGIRAMQQLQDLNSNKNRASEEMCMFLALNTSSVQLLPPVTLIALMGTRVSELIVPIILATGCSTLAAIIVAKLYARRQAP